MPDMEKGRKTSMTLIANAAANDQEAWTRMTEVYGPLVYYWCRKYGFQPEDASDVFQDVFRSLFGNLKNFKKESEGDKFRAYLWTITRNKMRDFAKVQAGKAKGSGGTEAVRLLSEVSETEDTSESVVISLSSVLQDAIGNIQSEFQEITWNMFWRVTVDDQNPGVVADELGVNIDSVYQAKSRVLKKLRAKLADIPF